MLIPRRHPRASRLQQPHRAGVSRLQARLLKPDSLTFLERITQRRRELNGEPNRCPPPRRTEDTGDIAQPGHNPAYVAAAIRGDLHRLAAATEGSRNHTLHSVACNIFEFVKGGHANEIAARAELERIATAIGLGHYEIQATLRSAWGRVGPRSVPAPGSVATACTIESPTHSTLFTISGSRPLPSSGALHPQNTGGEFSRGRHRALVALRNHD